MKPDYDVIIVGGGFAGIYAAWKLAFAGKRVSLIEKGPQLGGLLWSQEWNGFLVDMGMHNFDLRSSPGSDFYFDILGDDLLELPKHSWGSTTGAEITIGFEMPDFSNSDPELCKAALHEMTEINSSGRLDIPTSLPAFYQNKFGKSLGQRMTGIAEKIVGWSVDALSVDAAINLGMLSRPKLGSDEEMAALKQDPFWNERLGVSVSWGDPAFLGRNILQRFGYPKSGSLRGFCLAAQNRLLSLGVNLHPDTNVTQLEISFDRVVLSSQGKTISGRTLFWTLPDQPLLEMLGIEGIELKSGLHPVGVVVHAFEVPISCIKGPDYLHDFNTERMCYRYSSPGLFGGQVTNGRTYVLAEIPCHPSKADVLKSSEIAKVVWSELISSGFIEVEAQYFNHKAWCIPVAYTVPTTGWEVVTSSAEEAIFTASHRIIGISFGQRGRAQFMHHFNNELLPKFEVIN